MIDWLLQLLGIAPRVPPARRRSLVGRLKDSTAGDRNGVVGRAEAALERHQRREQAIETHQAVVEEQKAKCKQERRKAQSEINESTILLDAAARKATTRKRRRREDNPFLASELARRKAEGGG